MLDLKELNTTNTFKNMSTYWGAVPEPPHCLFVHISVSHRLSNISGRDKSSSWFWGKGAGGVVGYKFLSSFCDTPSAPWSYWTIPRCCRNLFGAHIMLLNVQLLCLPQPVAAATYCKKCQSFLKVLCLLWEMCLSLFLVKLQRKMKCLWNLISNRNLLSMLVIH